MKVEHEVLTFLKGKDFVWAGEIEDHVRATIRTKGSSVDRALRTLKNAKKIIKTERKAPTGRNAKLYKHICEQGKCGDVMDNVTKKIYHKMYGY